MKMILMIESSEHEFLLSPPWANRVGAWRLQATSQSRRTMSDSSFSFPLEPAVRTGLELAC